VSKDAIGGPPPQRTKLNPYLSGTAEAVSKPRIAELGTLPPAIGRVGGGDSLYSRKPSAEAVPNRRLGPFSRPAA
jgi:hypothetical protein